MDIAVLQSIWERFVETGELDPRMNPIVAKSWVKCRKHGLDPMSGLGKHADETVFRSILAENKDLIDTALPVMQSVYEIVERSHFLLVLTDSVGYVLETIGDTDVQKMSNELHFLKGALWSDLEVGSNAIGMALDYDTAIQTVGPEHYGRPHHNWTCSAAPIHGANGEVIGCLDLSGDVHGAHPHTLGLVVAAAFSIETMLIRLQSTRMMREALNGSEGSVVLLDDGFHPIWINKAAEKFLGLSINKLENTDFREMMPDVDWGQLQQWSQKGQYITNDTRLAMGKCIYDCSAVITPTLEANKRTFTVNIKRQEHLIDSVNKVSGNRANYTFSSIYAQDPLMKKVVQLPKNMLAMMVRSLLKAKVVPAKNYLPRRFIMKVAAQKDLLSQ